MMSCRWPASLHPPYKALPLWPPHEKTASDPLADNHGTQPPSLWLNNPYNKAVDGPHTGKPYSPGANKAVGGPLSALLPTFKVLCWAVGGLLPAAKPTWLDV